MALSKVDKESIMLGLSLTKIADELFAVANRPASSAQRAVLMESARAITSIGMTLITSSEGGSPHAERMLLAEFDKSLRMSDESTVTFAEGSKLSPGQKGSATEKVAMALLALVKWLLVGGASHEQIADDCVRMIENRILGLRPVEDRRGAIIKKLAGFNNKKGSDIAIVRAAFTACGYDGLPVLKPEADRRYKLKKNRSK